MTSAYLSWTTRRLSLSVGVSSSVSAVHSTGSRCHRLTCWTRASRSFAAATAAPTSVSTTGSAANSASEPGAAPRAYGAMTFDGATNQVVLFSGSENALVSFPTTTWAWNGSTWSQI